MRALRDQDGEAFDEARRYYEETLLPRVAEEGTDPIEEWLDYGRRLAEMSGPGELVEIDEEGRARVAATPATRDRLILYLPASPREPGRIINLPVRLSAAQRANVDLLIEGRLD